MIKRIFYIAIITYALLACSDDYSVEDEFVIGSVEDIDGNVYETVEIGNQTWMAENLRVTHYASGEEIPLVTDNAEWANLGENNTDKAYCYYNNNAANGEEYGALYTFAAAVNGTPYTTVDVQGVCPDGWHVPNTADWMKLVNYVGGADIVGAKLKEKGTSHWVMTNNGVKNSFYFTALPGGDRYLYDGAFERKGYTGYWWSSEENTTADAYVFRLHNSSDGYIYSLYGKSYGLSIRCLKD